MEPGFSALEESFFAEGDALSAIPEEIFDGAASYAWSAPLPALPFDPPPSAVQAIEAEGSAPYYASLHLTIEADEISGGFDAAA